MDESSFARAVKSMSRVSPSLCLYACTVGLLTPSNGTNRTMQWDGRDDPNRLAQLIRKLDGNSTDFLVVGHLPNSLVVAHEIAAT